MAGRKEMAEVAAGRGLDDLRAQYTVCRHLTRACRQAMFKVALDEEDAPGVKRRSIELLKEVLGDWNEAQKWLRREIAERDRSRDFTGR